MDKKIWLLGLLGVLAGLGLGVFRTMKNGAVAAKAAQDMFPPEKLNGYVQGTHIQVRDDGHGGRPVVAVAVTPFGIKPGQISPTGYNALKLVRRSFPKADWISVFIAEDSAMAEASEWVGVAEMRAGKVTVTGGIPSGPGLDSLSKAGGLSHRPTQADLKAVATLFDSTSGLSAERWDESQTLLGAGSGRIDKSGFFALHLETTSLHAAAKALGMDPKQLQALALGVTRFYWAKAGDPL